MSTSSSSNKRLHLSDPSFNKSLHLSDSSSVTPGASTSTSSIQNRFKYDVFLSFRGADTRKNFVGHLYHALEAKCIETYKDDEKIEQGGRINDQLLKSIEESRFFIVVFSKTYASSSWCLNELVKIIECQKKIPEQTAYPVFYDVEPTEVRKQSGAVKEAFAEHEKKEDAGKWRDAMKELADLAGWELKATTNGDESKSIQIIVDAIFKKLHSTNSSADGKLVGMETRISDILSSLEIRTEDVRMIGIKGMGGGGKTTLARAVYDQISNHFEGKSFVENVREGSQPSLSGLKKLQKRILKDVLNKQDITFSSVHDGKNMLKATMRRRKILIVLDDVDRIEQLEALAGEPDWFKSGSRIIITTRDEQLLRAHGVNFVHDVNLLSHEEAICLFSRYAFQKEIPIRGYEELSGQVVRYAAGLPLTIKVLGSFLCCKDRVVWVDAIERLEKIPLKETMEKLELSYMSLEDDYKDIFLDIACILKGEDRLHAIRVLECCGFHARNGLKVLEQRSLITISKDDVLGMHDHIEEMGKNIVRRLHPDEPNKHSRLWIDEEIEDVLANDMGTEATRCLKFSTSNRNARIVMKSLGKMKKLRYLKLEVLGKIEQKSERDEACLGKMKKFRYLKLKLLGEIERGDACLGRDPKFDKSIQYLPNSLRYLICLHYPFLYLPKTFQANNLVELKIMGSRLVQLWEEGEKKVLKNLRFLSLSGSKLTTYDFRMTPNLETLRLIDSPNLVQLCMPVSCQKLKHLCISYSKLRTFDLGLTPNLEALSLGNCADFEELHLSVACPNLKFLDLSVSRLRSLDLGLTPNLKWLSLGNCAHFVKLRVSLACPNLIYLNLCGSRLRSLDLELIPNLESLDLEGCDKLVEINAPVGCLKKVRYLYLDGCWRFTNFVFRERSEPKVSRSSATLHLFGLSLYQCPLHPNSNLPKFRFRCYYEDYLPSSVGNIEKLISTGICACTDLKRFSDMICSLRSLRELKLICDIEFPKDLGKLECLQELYLSSTKIKHLPDSICMLKHLKSLKLDYCALLEKLPENLGQLECLEKLCVSSRKIEYVPDSICMLKRLKWLDVANCSCLGKLPEDIGQLECLEELHLSSTEIKHLPVSICMLKHLKYLNLSLCAHLEKLPEDLGRLECLKKLILIDTGIRHLPQSIFGLKGLLIAASQSFYSCIIFLQR